MTENVLLLQGPMGPFFQLFAKELKESGNEVYKINFNGGDDWFYDDKNTTRFTGKLNQWDDFFNKQLNHLNIDKVYLFGDCRIYHAHARKIAINKGLRVFVFEEGYIRPHCITLEEAGVNGHSTLPKKPSLYPYTHPKDQDALTPLQNTFGATSRYAITYYIAARLMAWKYTHYQHHRPLSILSEGYKWILAAQRKLSASMNDPETIEPLIENQSQPYFFCPLQLSTDMQIKEHSRFRDMDELIQDVIHSFANYAAKNAKLVFKHHPLDRGYKNYSRVIHVLSKLHGIQDRVIYIHDCNLPKLLKNARGTITINSTVGLSSLYHGTPVIALGKAVYNMEGLTYQGDLDRFWLNPGDIDLDLYHRFRTYLLEHNQANGSFYRKLNSATTATGILWPDTMASVHGLSSASNTVTTELETRSIAAPGMDLGSHYTESATEALSTTAHAETPAPIAEATTEIHQVEKYLDS